MMRTILGVFFCIALSSTLGAQPVRTWVSSSGLDTNPCSRTAPCRQFSVAINAVASNGEVIALDSGGYGPVVVNKPVAIVAPQGVHAAIAPTAGTAIQVEASVTGPVLLRNLFLNGQGADNGIVHNGLGALSVVQCEISRFGNDGIQAMALNPGDSLQFSVFKSTLRDCARGINIGFGSTGEIEGCLLERHTGAGISTSFTNALIRNTVVIASGSGYSALGGSGTMEVIDSAAYSCGVGFSAYSPAPGVAMSMDRCVSSGNGTGVSGPISMIIQVPVRIANSMITNNDMGVSGAVLTRGDNTIESNALGNAGGTPYAAK